MLPSYKKNLFKKNLLHRLKIARGHLERVIEMVENDRYCLDIIQQTKAVESSLRKIDELLLENHLKTCVKKALISEKGVDEKVKEVIEVFRKR